MPYIPYKEQSKTFKERPWVFVYGALLSAAGFVNVLLVWRIHHFEEFSIDRWGYFPPQEDEETL